MTDFISAVEQFLAAKAAGKKAENTLAAYRRDLLGIGQRIGALHLKDLTLAAVEAGFASWASDHSGSSTLRAWKVWNGFFEFLLARRLIESNPMPGIERATPAVTVPRRIDADDAVERLLEAARHPTPEARRAWPERDVALIAVFLFTGIRLAEAADLTLDCLGNDGQGNWRLRVKGKGNKERVLPLAPEVKTLLYRYLDARAARFPADSTRSPLFVHTSGRALNRDHISYLVRRLYLRAGLEDSIQPGTRVHALRHTFGIRLVDAGTPITVVQELLGHQSLNTTQRYLKATASELQHAATTHPDRGALRDLLT